MALGYYHILHVKDEFLLYTVWNLVASGGNDLRICGALLKPFPNVVLEVISRQPEKPAVGRYSDRELRSFPGSRHDTLV